jgi:RNase P subunit RPR2
LIYTKALTIMASKRTQQPTPKAVLKSPASTTNPGVGRPHVCKKCNQQFLSENAMKKHRDAPSHDTMFSCETCNRKFGSRHAVGQHEESQPHTKKLAQMMAQMMAQTNAATASGAQEKGKGPATIPNPSKPHVCGKCNKPFSTLAAMEQHRASHDTAVPSRKKVRPMVKIEAAWKPTWAIEIIFWKQTSHTGLTLPFNQRTCV